MIQKSGWALAVKPAHKGLNIQDNRFGIFQRMGNIDVNSVTEGTLVDGTKVRLVVK